MNGDGRGEHTLKRWRKQSEEELEEGKRQSDEKEERDRGEREG